MTSRYEFEASHTPIQIPNIEWEIKKVNKCGDDYVKIDTFT